MATPADFAKMVPGFDFLQGLMKGAGSSLPNIGQWIAPTLDPAELEKRIQELKTVQFWLEQNARMLGATIQALEVQRMTLATLKTMNMPVAEVRKAFELKTPAPAPAATPAEPPAAPPAPRKTRPKPAAQAPAAPPAAGGGSVDPMQWWGALTRQFGELAANALKDGASAPAAPPAAPKAAAAARKRKR